MIEFAKCPVIDGKAFESLREAQRYGITQIITGLDLNTETCERVAETLIEHAEDVIAILSVKRPAGRPRGVPAQRKARKAKVAEEKALALTP